MRLLISERFGSQFRLNEGELEQRPVTVNPEQQDAEDWCEVDWDRGVEPENLAAVRQIQSQLEEVHA